ncbi:ATP-binding protein [Oceanobacillus salinisoli]|uniref:ATP-binding protein n=1 Tax=Oceanobacillus salinisoli TaxID=2678611 RepID=UPI0012E1F781|nr:ATP-binding protein [Oceanobacillus salinisoli]
MNLQGEKINAEVISVYPNKVKISVDNLEDFRIAEESLKVGSYLRILDNENAILIAIIENFSIEVRDDGKKDYIIEANPLGMIIDNEFIRGGDSIAIPPKKVEIAKEDEIVSIYEHSINDTEKFTFSSLSSNGNIKVPVNGNRFFNKHIAIVGSTGSGKSHTVSTILQKAVNEKIGDFDLNNSHIIIFDIHSEYSSAFPKANLLDINNLVLPYWLLKSDELTELFIDTEANDHNQKYIFKEAVVNNRRENFSGHEKENFRIHFDSPYFFDINKVLEFITKKNSEVIDTGEVYKSGDKKGQKKTVQGSLYGKLTNFVNRLENKVYDSRLKFLLGDKSKQITFEETIEQLLGYKQTQKSNITVIDLSGVPFEVLSITVSLISRIIFEYGYYYKRMRYSQNPEEKINNDIPILMVYEEAHKYVPKSDLLKYRASKEAIERIAKEGRKYGVSLLLSSQRPSEISETIFSQCNNFIAMRLTNPNDQLYVKRLLPDTLGNITDRMPTFKAGEALLLGDAVVLPSIVQIDKCTTPPSSNDIPYLDLWKEEWKNLNLPDIKTEWYKQ